MRSIGASHTEGVLGLCRFALIPSKWFTLTVGFQFRIVGVELIVVGVPMLYNADHVPSWQPPSSTGLGKGT